MFETKSRGHPMKLIRSLLPALLVLAFAGPTVAAVSSESAALAVLASDAGLKEKARACQELGDVGGPKSVAPLAALLNKEHLADYARSGLEGIKDPSAGAALRKALPTLEGRFLSGVVNSLGVRRDTAAVPDLQKLALDPKRGVAEEALAALALIANRDATKTLQKVLTSGPAELRVPAAHALLLAAEQLKKDGKASDARELLDSVVKAQPPGQLANVAQEQIAVLKAKPGK
jgi:HEAT repeat protein